MMPLYDYTCEKCGTTREEMFGMNNFPRQIKCKCGSKMYKVCNAGGFQDSYGRSGGIQDDHPAWLESSLKQLQTPEERREKPIESRSEMYQYMKDNGIRFKERGHKTVAPPDKPISKETREKGIKAVAEAGYKARSITVNL